MCYILYELCPRTYWQGAQKWSIPHFPDVLVATTPNISTFLASKLKLKWTIWKNFHWENILDNATNKLQKLVLKVLKTRYLTKSNNLTTNYLTYSHNSVLTVLKVTILSFDRLPLWRNKFNTLIATMSHPIFLFRDEVDSNEKIFDSSLCDSNDV